MLHSRRGPWEEKHRTVIGVLKEQTQYNSEAPGNKAHAANGLFLATKGVQLGELSRIAFTAQ